MTSAGQFGPYPFIDSRGNALPAVEILIYDSTGTTLASLYSDRARTPLANPLPTGVADGIAGVDTSGNAIFWADADEYLMVVRYGGTQRYQAPITISADPDDANAVLSVNGRSGIVVGLAEQSALATEIADRAAADLLLIPLTQRGAANGVATLDAGSKVPTAQLPALAITETFPVASQAAMLALTAQRGDVAIRTDLNKSFILSTDSPTTLADWKELLTPTDAVTSVNARVGVVSGLAEADASNVAASAAAWRSAIGAQEAGTSVLKGAQTVNIMDYAAVGDGTADDTAAWVAARAAAISARRRLVLPAGLTFKLTASPALWTGARIEADGATLDIQTDHSAAGRYLNLTSLTDVEVHGLGLACSNAAARNQLYGLLSIFGGNHILLEDVAIESGEGIGIFTGTPGMTDPVGVHDLHIVRPRISGVKADGIHLSRGATDVWVDSADIEGCADDGIALVSVLTDDGTHQYDQVGGVHIITPTVRDLVTLGSGISIVGAADVDVVGGIYDNLPANGIRISTGSGGMGADTYTPSNVDIVKPHVRRTVGSGIVFGACTDSTVTGGTSCDSSTGDGIDFIDAVRCTAVAVTARGNAGFGVYENGSTGCRARVCDLRDNTSGASQFETDGNSADFCITDIGDAIKLRASTGQTEPLTEWLDDNGDVVARLLTGGDFQTDTSIGVGDAGYLTASLSVKPLDVSVSGIVVQALASQAEDLQQWRASDDTVLTAVEADGAVALPGNAVSALHAVPKQQLDAGLATKQAAGTYVALVSGLPASGTDATSVIQTYIDAAYTAGGGKVILPVATISAPIVVSGLVHKSSVHLVGQGRNGTYLECRSGNLLSVSGNHFHIEDLSLKSTAAAVGDLIIQSGDVDRGVLRNVGLYQSNIAKNIWNNNGHGYIDMLVEDFDQSHSSGGAGNTVPSWAFSSTGGDVNRNTWSNGRHTGAAGSSAYAWKLDNGSAGSFYSDNVWRDLNLEILVGGGIWLGGHLNFTFDQVNIYDTAAATGSLFSIGVGSGGLTSRVGSVNNCGNRGATWAAGGYGFEFRATATTNVHFSGCTGTSGGAPFTINLNGATGNTIRPGTFYSVANGTATVIGDTITLKGGTVLGDTVTLKNGTTYTDGTGSPEGVLTAPIGSTYNRTDGGAGASLYVKERGAGNTGWVRQISASWTPLSIPGLVFAFMPSSATWQDSARTIPAVADGDPVGAWDDISTAAAHAVQATAGNRPLLKPGVFNGLPGLRFDGTDDALVTPGVAVTKPFTLVAVHRPTDLAASRPVVGATSSNKMGFYIDTAGKQTLTRTGNVAIGAGASGALIANATVLSTVTYDSNGVYTFHKNGVVDGTPTQNNQSFTTTASTEIGQDTASSLHYLGDIGAVLKWDSVLSADDLRAVEDWLSAKFSIGSVAAGQADVVEARIRGRKAGAGTGPLQDMTAAEAKTLLAITSGDVSDFTEATQDVLGGILAPDTGDLDWTYDDAGNAESVIVKTTRTADTAVTQVASGLTGATSASRYVGATAAGPPTTGTFAVGDFVVTQAGRIWVCTSAGTPGTWQPQINGAELDWKLPTGALADTYERDDSTSNLSALSSGRMSLYAIYLRAGQVIANITFWSGTTPLAVGSNQWFALFDASRTRLRVTADDTSTAWGANAFKTLALASSYTVPTSGLYYLGICVVASTVPTLTGRLPNSVGVGLAPILSGIADAGLTNPASCPSPATPLTAQSARPYAYVS